MNTNVQPIRIMLDLETMSLEDNAAIVQIGACTFGSSLPRQKFVVHIKPESSEKAGMHVDRATMAWWDKQDANVRNRVFGGTEELDEALASFQLWVKDQCAGEMSRAKIYSKGPEDWVWLRSSYYRMFGSFPFHYRSPQSHRTLGDLAHMFGIDLLRSNANNHDALEDACNQADEAEHILSVIGHAMEDRLK